jgi:ribosomal protein L37AE/L43A
MLGNNEDARYLCVVCGGFIDHQRYRLGYKLCLPCGEDAAKQVKHTIAPINKSNYMYISDLSQLKQLNPKRTT